MNNYQEQPQAVSADSGSTKLPPLNEIISSSSASPTLNYHQQLKQESDLDNSFSSIKQEEPESAMGQQQPPQHQPPQQTQQLQQSHQQHQHMLIQQQQQQQKWFQQQQQQIQQQQPQQPQHIYTPRPINQQQQQQFPPPIQLQSYPTPYYIPRPGSMSPIQQQQLQSHSPIQNIQVQRIQSPPLPRIKSPTQQSAQNFNAFGSSHLPSKCSCKTDDKKKIPRPRNAFILFRQTHHKDIVDDDNKIKTNPEVSRELGRRWKLLSIEDKKHWLDLAEKEKEDHAKKYPGYKYTPNRNKNKKCQYCINKQALKQKNKFDSQQHVQHHQIQQQQLQQIQQQPQQFQNDHYYQSIPQQNFQRITQQLPQFPIQYGGTPGYYDPQYQQSLPQPPPPQLTPQPQSQQSVQQPSQQQQQQQQQPLQQEYHQLHRPLAMRFPPPGNYNGYIPMQKQQSLEQPQQVYIYDQAQPQQQQPQQLYQPIPLPRIGTPNSLPIIKPTNNYQYSNYDQLNNNKNNIDGNENIDQKD